MRIISAEMRRAADRLVELRGPFGRRDDGRLGIAMVSETYPPEINGVARTVERVVGHLVDRGHGVQLLRPRQPADAGSERPTTISEYLTPGMRVPLYPDVRVGLGSRSTLARLWSLARPDVVHVATEGPLGFAALAAARRLDIPVTSDFRTNFHLYSEHYRLGWSRPLALSYLRWFHNQASLTTVPTGRLASRLAAQGFRRLRVVGRGVDSTLFSPARRSEALRRAWGAAADDLVVIHVGRLAPEKNPALVLAAFEAMRGRDARSRLVFVGDGPLRAAIERVHPEHVYAGWRRDIELAQCYASADVFVFPSLTETFGNVVLEALASGLAVVAFDDAAAGQYIRDGSNGVLARVGDNAGFVERAARLAGEPALVARLRAAARVTATALDWDRVLEEFEQALGAVACAHYGRQDVADVGATG